MEEYCPDDEVQKIESEFRNHKMAGFISTNFLPLINMKPSVICLGYEIKIASGLKVETNKIVRGCRLELEGHTFIIDLIPFGHGSFDLIVGMDWLSKMRAKIVFYEKIVQISLSNEDILEVHGECPLGNLKQLKTMKVNETKLEDIPMVYDFPSSKEEHEVHLKLQLDLLEKEKLFGKFSKCEFWLQEVLVYGNLRTLIMNDAHPTRYSVHPGADKMYYDLRGLYWWPRMKKDISIDYDCEIRYHPRKANVVVDVLSRKERAKPRRVRALSMTIHSSIKAKILEAQSEAFKNASTPTEMLKGLDNQLERKEDGRTPKTLGIPSTTRDSQVEIGEYHNGLHNQITEN
uniref:Putative reverse transcriptase domain-containing protein n=1 Tax=Tanacetum cinerariifolium TaxID=118510 RepID=A0A6L2MHU2_TANCI|nr:putative reverse transcriptase domain-containing protein [Tanacetum cinerariifolium]